MLVVVVVYFLKKKNLIQLSVKQPAETSVSFENPFYTSSRDNPSALQVSRMKIKQDLSSQMSSSVRVDRIRKD